VNARDAAVAASLLLQHRVSDRDLASGPDPEQRRLGLGTAGAGARFAVGARGLSRWRVHPQHSANARPGQMCAPALGTAVRT
jgi:hypothetical protein